MKTFEFAIGTSNKPYTRSYRFAFNGQEKDNEVAGSGNITTAEFWEYDARLGRRWNVDPKPHPSVSLYACFGNNPISFSDPDGDTVRYETLGDLIRVSIVRLFSRSFNQQFRFYQNNTNTYTFKLNMDCPRLWKARPDYGRKLSMEEYLAGEWRHYSIEYSIKGIGFMFDNEKDVPREIEINNKPSEQEGEYMLKNVSPNYPIQIYPQSHPDEFNVIDQNSGTVLLPKTNLVKSDLNSK